MEGEIARTVREMERGQMNHMEIKCVWERVNKKRGEKYGIKGNI